MEPEFLPSPALAGDSLALSHLGSLCRYFYLSLPLWLWSWIKIILGIFLHIKPEAYVDSVCPRDLKLHCQLGDYPHQCHVPVPWSCPSSRTLSELGRKGKELCFRKAMVKSTNAIWKQRGKCEEWSSCLWLGEAQKCRAVIGVSDGVGKEQARGLWWPSGSLWRLTLRRSVFVFMFSGETMEYKLIGQCFSDDRCDGRKSQREERWRQTKKLTACTKPSNLPVGLLDYKASGPLACSNFKHVLQALFEGICVLS